MAEGGTPWDGMFQPSTAGVWDMGYRTLDMGDGDGDAGGRISEPA